MYAPATKTLFLGKTLDYLPSCHSTNDLASEAIRAGGALEGAVFITDFQTAGRGQHGSSWESRPGENFTLSLLLKPTFLTLSRQFALSQAIALGVRDYLASYLPDVSIKWPNDLYLTNKKMGGILIENKLQGSRIQHAVVGIGLNINQTTFGDLRASSLALSTGRRFDLAEELPKLLLAIEPFYLRLRAGDTDFIQQQYLGYLVGLYQKRQYTIGNKRVEAILIGISPEGWLRLKLCADHHIREYAPKEVSWCWD